MTEPEPIRVGADAEVGSARLAEALASGDAEAIGRALRLDVVIIPLTRGSSGELQIRVFQTGTPEPDGGFDLCLFSSVPALAGFLAGDDGRDFDVQRGSTIAGFLREHHTRIGRVVFDPAGPHPVAAHPADVIAALEPRPDDDAVAWAASP